MMGSSLGANILEDRSGGLGKVGFLLRRWGWGARPTVGGAHLQAGNLENVRTLPLEALGSVGDTEMASTHQ